MFRSLSVLRQISFASVLLLLPACHKSEEPRNPEIEVEVQLTAASKAKTPEDVRPYDEALVWDEYAVKRVIDGKLDAPKIRVAHWSVVAARAVPVKSKIGEISRLKVVPFDSIKALHDVASSDDLEITADEPPRFLDLSQPLDAAHTPGVIRSDYRGNISVKMQLYWKLRSQLQLVVMGNSYAIKGINTRGFFSDENGRVPAEEGEYPAALNLAPAGGSIQLQCLLLHDYVTPLPGVHWVVWTVSPFLFNERRNDETRYEEFINSPGRRYDEKNRATLWPAPAAGSRLALKALRPLTLNSFDFWVQGDRTQTELPASEEEKRKLILKEFHFARFTWNASVFANFSQTVRELAGRGVQLLVLVPPVHPAVRDAAASDRHGTSHAGYAEMVAHMEALAKATPGMTFRDWDLDGRHDFTADEFFDTDHLNSKGAVRLTAKVKAWLEKTPAH